MARKSAAELAEEVARLERRLAKAKEKERMQTKAEEARTNASIIKVIKDYWDALPNDNRPRWEDMAEYVLLRLSSNTMTGEAEMQHEQELPKWLQ